MKYEDDYGYVIEDDLGGSGRVPFQHISSVDVPLFRALPVCCIILRYAVLILFL
jgi:hypothetical protein